MLAAFAIGFIAVMTVLLLLIFYVSPRLKRTNPVQTDVWVIPIVCTGATGPILALTDGGTGMTLPAAAPSSTFVTLARVENLVIVEFSGLSGFNDPAAAPSSVLRTSTGFIPPCFAPATTACEIIATAADGLPYLGKASAFPDGHMELLLAVDMPTYAWGATGNTIDPFQITYVPSPNFS